MRQARKGARTKEDDPVVRIVEAVCDVIADEGVGNLSLRKVAEKAGATIGLITHHFPNRAAMVKAAVEYAWEKAKKQIKWPTTVNEAEIIACLEAFLPLEQPRRRELSVWLAFWALTQTSVELQEIHRGIHTFMRDKHVRWIRLMGYSLEDARRIADGLLLQCDGILVYALLDEPYWTPDRQRAIVADAVGKVLHRSEPRSEG